MNYHAPSALHIRSGVVGAKKGSHLNARKFKPNGGRRKTHKHKHNKGRTPERCCETDKLMTPLFSNVLWGPPITFQVKTVFFLSCLFILREGERERERKRAGEGQREAGAGLELANCEIMT